MALLRTEFFETLNPRGRKCTTRWQQRLPRDEIVDRFDVADALVRLEELKGGCEDASLSDRKRALKIEQVRKMEELISNWRTKGEGNAMELQEAKGVIKTGLESLLQAAPEVTEADVKEMRIFEDFDVFTAGSDGYETSTSEAAKLFQEKGQMEGFNYMFEYRFS